jgi:CRP/FNR family cyclic AMP-dependent transcriptional regulator
MDAAGTIKLFHIEPDLTRFLAPEDREAVDGLRLPTIEAPAGELPARALLESAGAFGAIVLRGMILQSLRLGEYSGLRVIGPGDILALTDAPSSMLVLDASCRATTPTSLALLGREFLAASRRWPWLVAGLHARSGEQAERVTTQLMICQLPRVDDRLLSMLWLLSESWGQVTPSGTVLPLELTHSALGGLIGARRPTVTLALSELSRRGAVVRQRDGWLLLEAPKAAAPGDEAKAGDPHPLAGGGSAEWRAAPLAAGPEIDDLARQELRESVERLRAAHETSRQQVDARVEQLRATRSALLARRERIRRDRARAPSS